MPELTEEDVFYILQNMECIRNSTEFIEKQAVNLMTAQTELIRQLSMPGLSGTREGRTYGKPRIHDVVENYRSTVKDNLNEAERLVMAVKEEREVLSLVTGRMYTLPEPYRSVLIMLYIKHEKWETICRELVISKTTLKKLRNTAVRGIAAGRTESGNADSGTASAGERKNVRDMEGQMSLQEYLKINALEN